MNLPIAPAKQYEQGTLSETDLDNDPIRQFGRWLEAAAQAGVPEPNAMTVATASRTGIPSARIVLLKHFDARGFAFFTNYDSPKGLEITENPQVALVFFWPTLERQIRITGTATRTSVDESAEYFHSRPVASQLGAWASPQSEVIASRQLLEERYAAAAARFPATAIPLPPFWGGFRVRPTVLEFWQGRASRLHDRFRYLRGAHDPWTIERLSP